MLGVVLIVGDGRSVATVGWRLAMRFGHGPRHVVDSAVIQVAGGRSGSVTGHLSLFTTAAAAEA